jgi:hypothetical protein
LTCQKNNEFNHLINILTETILKLMTFILISYIVRT